MSALLFLPVLLGSLSALTCPPEYKLIEGRCIRLIELFEKFILDDDLPQYRAECAKDGAHFPVIKNDDDNENFGQIVYSINGDMWLNFFLVMDLVCNPATRRLEWADGSRVTYSRKDTINFDFDCVETKQTAVSALNPGQDLWTLVNTTRLGYYYTVLCDYDNSTPVKPTEKPTETPVGQCGDYSVMETSSDAREPCMKVYTEPQSWNLAQRKCAADFASLTTINSAEENKYIWRTAINSNIVGGMHIGAHQSPVDQSVWTWSDGEVPIDGKTYSNIMSVFPIPGAGECASMLTGTTAAYWINENCEENEQPFICRRADFSTMPKTCPTDVPKADEDFYPPGFPNSDIPCPYMLFVAANKLVELEVITLVAEDNKDSLDVLEETSGAHLLANLTGTILSPRKIRTAKSNVMRVNWKPNGSGSGRGFRIRYTEVNP